MPLTKLNHGNLCKRPQFGATLIEVLVSVLILSFGMLALGGMLSMSVQLPKLAAFRATAAALAAGHVERIRANVNGFSAGNYSATLIETSGWDLDYPAVPVTTVCAYTTPCTASTLATQDTQDLRNSVRRALPGGDLVVQCSPTPCARSSYGEIWIVWQEPSASAVFAPGSSDNCPAAATTLYTTPPPRCLYLRFKIE